MKKYLLFFILFISAFAYTQENDTIYIYEEVIEYDTVFVKKSGVVINPADQRPGYRKRTFRPNTDFSFLLLGGVKQISSFQADHAGYQRGAGIGVLLRRNVFTPEMSISLGMQFFMWPENHRIKSVPAQENTDGIYFNNLSKPAKFLYFSNEHNEINVPLNFYYTWKNFSPYFGFFLNYTTFKMHYEIESRTIPNQSYAFAANQYNFGYTTGILYQNNRFGISLEYQHHEFLKMNFWNRSAGNINLKFKDGFQDHKFLLGIHLSLVK